MGSIICTKRLPPGTSARRVRGVILLGALHAALIACDGAPRARDGARATTATVGSEATLFADAADAPGDISGTVRVSSRIVAVSEDGSEADIALAWSPEPTVRQAIDGDTRLIVRLERGATSSTVLSRQRVAADDVGGEVIVTVPADAPDARLSLGLDGLASNRVDDLPNYTVLALPSLLRPPDTDLDALVGLNATLVEDSYRSSLEAGRRLHRFSITVEGTLADGRRTAVTGLDAAASRHFMALEHGYDDPESPVRATWQSDPVTVYLVMDVSSSITLAGAADDLLDAVSRTLLSLAPVARFDYRVFASDVYEIEGLRELAFDDVEDSGTAMYRAIDTALDDMERAESGDAVMIVFTDGRDFASRNFYPAFRSHAQVHDHLVNRLRNVERAQRELAGRRFETHVVSLGSDVDAPALESLAAAGAGHWFPSYDTATIEDAFAHLTDGVRGVYALEYSSQQLPDDTQLELVVRIGALDVPPIVLPTRNGLAPSD